MPNKLSFIYSVVFLGVLLQPSVFGATAAIPVTDRQAARLLDQASWGPTPASIADVQSQGLSAWIDNQFTATPSDLPDQALLDVNGNSNNNVGPVQAAMFVNAVNGPDQLLQRVTFALSQIWVVSQQAGVTPAYAYPEYWRVIRNNAFGNYADIIRAVTLNPAMGRYLNMANNNKAPANSSTAANENYARELMQLFTLGLSQLNLDGSLVLDAHGAPIPTYTEAQVHDLAKVFTGWTYPTAPGVTPKTNNPAYYLGQMFSVQANHDISQKVIVGGYTIAAGQTADAELATAIQVLMQQTTMAPFVCRQLIEHLVMSNPSPAYIQRVSSVFRNNGSGVTGDMKSVLKAILLDPEARTGDSPNDVLGSSSGHLREPVLLMASLLRGLNAAVLSTNNTASYVSALSENIFNEPSVFSYFSPTSRTEHGLYGPEFQIYTTQTSSARANTIYSLIYSTLGTTRVNLAPFYAKAPTLGTADLTAMVDYISYIFFHHAASTNLTSTALTAAKAASTAAHAVQSALFVMLTSGEYQVIH